MKAIEFSGGDYYIPRQMSISGTRQSLLTLRNAIDDAIDTGFGHAEFDYPEGSGGEQHVHVYCGEDK